MMMMMMMMLTNKPLPIIFALMQPVAARGSTVRTGDNDEWMRVAWLEESHNCADTSTERGGAIFFVSNWKEHPAWLVGLAAMLLVLCYWTTTLTERGYMTVVRKIDH